MTSDHDRNHGAPGITRILLTCAVVFMCQTVTAARALDVSLELILAVDCSSSVEPGEFALQKQGIADAFRHPTVVKAISAAAPNGIAITLVQWSGASAHSQTLGWMRVSDRESAERAARAIETAPRFLRWGATAIGEAIAYSLTLFEDNGFEGLRKVIDISGDGASNQGTFPIYTREVAAKAGVTVNGLAILNDDPSLDIYYRQQVIAGARAFVEQAARFEDFAVAMRRKLIREIGSPPSARSPVETGRQLAKTTSTAPSAPKSATTVLPGGALKMPIVLPVVTQSPDFRPLPRLDR
ncbi:MAG: DUF1194 domain-containing protein [Rhodospirillaceae bacterium]|jgi:hypothetical protein|nr:DUF1194 domain-containing protein [Rhodospirillaceae bacterium]MBT5665085.1 DUF1194 domain-containing protein [Rhodospirillaceae bacterium]MBT5811902.1 DUF1194 domain-containing protein [Rhodospirillaceae bacterium]